MAGIDKWLAACDDPIVFFPFIPVIPAGIPPQAAFLDIA